MPQKLKVVVLMGGPSGEREISLQTGAQIYQALKGKGYSAVTIDLGPDIVERLNRARGDLVFIALHGSPGEDGTIQGLLETLMIPYVGSRVLASALGMDKVRSKLFFASIGIPAPFYMPVEKGELKNSTIEQISERLLDSLGLPMVVKPSKEGSAIGVAVIRERDAVKSALANGLEQSGDLIFEEYIEGVEITVGVLGNSELETLPIVEIVPENEFYDFEAKYDGKSKHVIPARISEKEADLARKYALAAHLGLGCRNFSRVDFIIGKDDHLPYILEINTIPGMTPVSLFPEAAKAAGLEFPELIDKLVKLALEE